MVRHAPSAGDPRCRGSATTTVVVVVALLFIIGSVLLLVARFEREGAQGYRTGRDLQAVTQAAQDSIILQLREDIVGNDGIPYNRGWSGDSSPAEDFADLPGYVGTGGV